MEVHFSSTPKEIVEGEFLMERSGLVMVCCCLYFREENALLYTE